MVLLNIDYASRRHLLCPVSRQQLFVPRHGHRVSVRLVVAPSLLPVQQPATRFLTTSAIRYKKSGFHYSSWRLHGPSTRLVETRARQHGPCWRVMETGHPSTRAGLKHRQFLYFVENSISHELVYLYGKYWSQ